MVSLRHIAGEIKSHTWIFSQRLSIVFQHETVDGKLEIVPYNLNHKICAHFNVCALTILKKDLGVLVVWYDVSK